MWRRLEAVKALSYTACSGASGKSGWTGEAKGAVSVQRPALDCILFVEAGAWEGPDGKGMNFSNTYRWTRCGAGIRLAHLRFGADRPVDLVDLIPATETHMRAEMPHVCAADRYDASLELGEELILRWCITGPRKQDTIECRYSV